MQANLPTQRAAVNPKVGAIERLQDGVTVFDLVSDPASKCRNPDSLNNRIRQENVWFNPADGADLNALDTKLAPSGEYSTTDNQVM